jgi:AAA domain
MNITKGKIAKAQKVVIYGPEGIGKSSFASKFLDPLFIDTEGSTNNMEVARLDKPTSWTMLLQQIEWVKQTKPCQSLIIDTMDWAERLGIEFVCSRASKDSITKFGYGEGFIQLEEEFGKLLNKLSDLTEAGIHVVLTAHAKINKFEQPDEMGAYDRWELKLGNKTTAKTSALVKEWADMVLFANYKTFVVGTDDKGKKFKGQGGQRVIYTSHHPAWDAKNRFGLPEEIPLDYTIIAHIFTATHPTPVSVTPTPQPTPPVEPPKPETPTQQVSSTQPTNLDFKTDIKVEANQDIDYTGIPQSLADLMRPEQVTVKEIQAVVSQKGYYTVDTPIANYDASFISGVLVAAWQQVLEKIKENRTLPF